MQSSIVNDLAGFYKSKWTNIHSGELNPVNNVLSKGAQNTFEEAFSALLAGPFKTSEKTSAGPNFLNGATQGWWLYRC